MNTTSSVGLRDIALAISALDARLDQVAALTANWDGRQAAPVDPALVRSIQSWASSMPGWALAPAPAVVPLASGAVQLEWHSGSRILELEFETPTAIHFLQWHPGGGTEAEGTFAVTNRELAEELIEWVREGAANG